MRNKPIHHQLHVKALQPLDHPVIQHIVNPPPSAIGRRPRAPAELARRDGQTDHGILNPGIESRMPSGIVGLHVYTFAIVLVNLLFPYQAQWT